MGAAFCDHTVGNGNDPARIADGRKPVGNDQGGAALRQGIKGTLDLGFCHTVQCGSGFVQDENGRVFQEDTGNGDPLLLSAGEKRAPFAHIGVKALGHSQNIIENFCFPGGLHHFLHGGIGFAVADIFKHRIGKEENILLNDADVLVQTLLGHIPNVQAVDADAAAVHIVKTGDQLAKIGEDEVAKQLAELAGSDAAGKILSYIRMEESFEKTLEKITALAGGEAEDTDRLKTLYGALKDNGLAESFVLDPSITRGLDYYTGIVYETFLDRAPEFGSVCSGGRYNNLASLYTKTLLPGVGASIGIDRLISALEALGKQNDNKALCDTIIFNTDESLLGHYTKIALMLREKGISCDLYPETKKLNKQFGYVEKKHIPVGIICGSDEYSTGTVTVKDLTTRENYDKLPLDKGIEKIISLLRHEA